MYIIQHSYVYGYARASGGDKIRHDRCSRFTVVGITVIILILLSLLQHRGAVFLL